jgi:acyl carrier protein
MDVTGEVVRMLDEVLSLNGRSASFSRATHLLGAVPELDSMAVVSLMTVIEERFGIAIDDSEIDGNVFATVGSLSDFVTDRLAKPATA